MSTNSNFSMIIDHQIVAPGQGTLVKGRIEGGAIHIGDIIQVSNEQPGPTVEVGRISIGSQVVSQASASEEAVLLLVGLNPAQVHPGDRLVPGRADRLVRTPEEEPWPKLPERILPLRRLRDILGSLALLTLLSLFLIFPIFILIGALSSPPTELGGWIMVVLFMLGWYGFLGWVMYITLHNFFVRLHGRRAFSAGKGKAQAHILRRSIEVHEGQYSDSVHYELHIEFNPLQANQAPGVQQYKLDVNERLYNKLAGNDTVLVTYATRDPRIFLIEGEE